jgi:hypothetical protein
MLGIVSSFEEFYLLAYNAVVTTRCYISEDITLHKNRCDNHKFHISRSKFHTITMVSVHFSALHTKLLLTRVGKMRKAYKMFSQKLEGKGPRLRHSHRWEDNIKTYLTEIVCGLN